MAQLSLYQELSVGRIINVASVPQRSPFRYPGGKTWLIPHIRKWLTSLPVRPKELIEPFAGGGIVSLTAVFEGLTDKVTMVELDDQVAAVWRTILSKDYEWLANKVATFNFTQESVERELNKPNPNLKEKAFITLLKNRVYHGGILAPGSGFIKRGENGKGIKSRWYPQTLKKRILYIGRLRHRIHFIEGDGMKVLRNNVHRTDTVFFIDPPYTVGGKKAGMRLYMKNELDHAELFNIAETLVGDFLITYDTAEEVRKLAERHVFDTEVIPMKNTHHAQMTELLIGRNLAWVRSERENSPVLVNFQ